MLDFEKTRRINKGQRIIYILKGRKRVGFILLFNGLGDGKRQFHVWAGEYKNLPKNAELIGITESLNAAKGLANEGFKRRFPIVGIFVYGALLAAVLRS